MQEAAEESRAAREQHAHTGDELSMERDASRRLRLQATVLQGHIEVRRWELGLKEAAPSPASRLASWQLTSLPPSSSPSSLLTPQVLKNAVSGLKADLTVAREQQLAESLAAQAWRRQVRHFLRSVRRSCVPRPVPDSRANACCRHPFQRTCARSWTT